VRKTTLAVLVLLKVPPARAAINIARIKAMTPVLRIFRELISRAAGMALDRGMFLSKTVLQLLSIKLMMSIFFLFGGWLIDDGGQ
jgi:hypothetical protein